METPTRVRLWAQVGWRDEDEEDGEDGEEDCERLSNISQELRKSVRR